MQTGTKRKLTMYLFAAFALTLPAPSYHMTVFAVDGGLPHRSHVFAVFARTDRGPAGDTVQVVTISWMPGDGRIALDRSKPGRNYTLAETVQWARGIPTLQWGPYPITAELYLRAVTQARRLESGQVRYKALDRQLRPRACNCIHAVSDLGGPLDTGAAFGFRAAEKVVKHLGIK